jgi:HAD superfamily hydrolase (TIGR01484 family)
MTKFPKVVFSDFDGTLTEQGKFSPAFFDVLDIIKKNNSELVIVTGRPLSWAHFLLTHFDLNCVVTEGGGMLSIKKDEGESFKDIALIDKVNIQNLEKVSEELIEAFEGLILSEDSSCRNTDRAIDLGLMAKIKKDVEIENFFNDRQINFSRSNVHLNFWSGDISKKSSIEYYMKLKNINQSDCVFIGDSLNDESAFEFMENSVGVANICEVEGKLEHFPNIILRGKDKEEIYGVKYFLNSLL